MAKPWLDTVFDKRTHNRESQRRMKSYVDQSNVVAMTADRTLTDNYLGAVLTNTGAAATVTLTLPPAIQGMQFLVMRTASYAFRIDPNGTETIRGGDAGKYVELDSDGDSIELICVVNGQWEIKGGNIYRYVYE